MNYAIYLRVSTQKQGASGLGLEAQMAICKEYIERNNGKLLATFKDIESGKSRTRQGLIDAISFCKENDCTLVIAKLDRLARDVEFTFKVINTGIQIHFCDMPQVNTMILGVFASVAQYERELISTRTKSALDAKKARGETWTRNTNPKKAVQASIDARIKRAKQNQNNIFLQRYIENYEQRYGKLHSKVPNEQWDLLVKELNTLGAKTASGLEFNRNRLRSMVAKLKKEI